MVPNRDNTTKQCSINGIDRVLIVLRGVVHGVGDGRGQGLDSSLGRLIAFNGLAEFSFPTTTGIKSSLKE